MKPGPRYERFYDIAIPAPVLAQVMERRRCPTGFPHEVDIVLRGDEEVYRYPFDKMELGDFFVVARRGRSEKSMRTIIKQAAARYDYELFIAPFQTPNGPGFRVCLTIIGVTKYKTRYEQMTGNKVHISDGRWKSTRKQRNNHPTHIKPEMVKATPKPFWADDDPEIVELQPAPEQHTSPAEIRARMLRELQGG